MALEEEISLSDQEKARELARILKDMDISSQIRHKMSLNVTLSFLGTYPNFSSLIEAAKTEPGIWQEDIEAFSHVKQILDFQRSLISDAMEKYQIGDRVEIDSIEGFSENVAQDDSGDAHDVPTLIGQIYLIQLLEQNNLLEEDEDGYRLIGKIGPDDAILMIFAHIFPEVPHELLETNHIRSIFTAGDEEEWKVIIGPDLVFCEDLSPIESFLVKNLGEDEDWTGLLTRIHMKHLVVSEILMKIRERGNISRDEIREEFSSCEIGTGEDASDIILNLSTDYIDALLEDLKKTGYIKGKDQKLRLAF